MMIRACDGCGDPLSHDDERIRIFLDKEYPGRDVCQNCDLKMFLAANMAAKDALKNQRPGTALIELAAAYGLNVGFKDESPQI